MAEIDPLAFQKGFQATQNIFDSARQNRLADLAMGQKMQELQQQNALAGIVGNPESYDAAGNLRREVLPQIAQANPAAYGGFRKQIAEQDAVARQAQQQQRTDLMDWIKYSQERMANVRDPQTWLAFKSEASQVFPQYASRLPDQYDPNAIAQAQRNSVPYLEQLKLQQRQQEVETQRRGQDITMRGQDITSQTARRGQEMTDARARDEAAIKRGDSKTAQAQQERVRDASDALGLLDQAEKLIPQATGSYLGAGRDIALRSIGAATDAGNAAAQLRALEGALVSKMPKMSGPQSDKDVAMYRQMAGQIGDPTIPAETKQAAIRTIREIQNKYAGNAAAPAAAAKPAPASGIQDQTGALAELQRRAASDPALAAKLKAMGY